MRISTSSQNTHFSYASSSMTREATNTQERSTVVETGIYMTSISASYGLYHVAKFLWSESEVWRQSVHNIDKFSSAYSAKAQKLAPKKRRHFRNGSLLMKAGALAIGTLSLLSASKAMESLVRNVDSSHVHQK